MSSIDFGLDDIVKIIHNSDQNKAHGMLSSVSVCLKYAVTLLINHFSYFSDVVPVHKKGNKLWKITVLCLCFQFVVILQEFT